MKKLLLTLIFCTLSLHATSDELRKAITQSDIDTVKEILKTSSLSKKEIKSLVSMSKNIIYDRKFKERVAYIPEILIGVPSAIATIHISLVALSYFVALCINELSKDFLRILPIMCLAPVPSSLMTYLAYKLYDKTHKWHYDAIQIKELIESQQENFNTETIA